MIERKPLGIKEKHLEMWSHENGFSAQDGPDGAASHIIVVYKYYSMVLPKLSSFFAILSVFLLVLSQHRRAFRQSVRLFAYNISRQLLGQVDN